MNIRGYFGRGGAAFVKPTLISNRLGIENDIEFMVDSGASKTVLMDREARFLGLDYSRLRRREERMGGIGGKVDTYIIDDVELLFEIDGGIHIESFGKIFVLKHETTDLETERWLNNIPSLLGRDLLDKYGLLIDKNRGLVMITDENISIGPDAAMDETGEKS